jgi:hypothetical protein
MFSELRKRLRRLALLHGPLKAAKTKVRKAWVASVEFIRKLPGLFSLGLPNGFYSDLELLQANPPKLEGRVILLDQGNFEAAGDSLLVLCGRNQHQMQPWSFFWARHPAAELIGTSLALVDPAGRVCAESVYQQFGKHPFGLDDPAYLYPRLLSRPRRLDGNWTSIVSRWIPTSHPAPYAHWLLELLPRLSLLKEFPADTGILAPPFRLGYQEESLSMLGVLDRCRWTSEKHLRIENYYFSAQPSMICCFSPYVVAWLRTTFLPIVEKDLRPTPRRFFVRRVGTLRNIVNEDEVLDFFRSIGWEIVDSARLSFADQIRYFSRAEAICSIHGSGFTNAVWGRPGIKLLELLPDSYMGSEVEWIARCIPGAMHRYLIFPSDRSYNAIVDLHRVRQKLSLMGLL